MRPSRPSRTAEAVCFMRAAERLRAPPGRILDDPYAATFLGPAPRAALAAGPLAALGFPPLATFVVARHRFIDDALAAALSGPVAQVVLLGAGYDSRAWRFAEAFAGRPVFEVDHPATQARKARLAAHLPPAPNLRRVPIDFQTETLADVLPAAGFRVGAPAFFVWEGVTMYLHDQAVRSTLTTLRALGGVGSSLAMDAWHRLEGTGPVGAANRIAARGLALVGEPITFGLPPDDAPRFLAELGWTTVDLADALALERRYVHDGRRVYPADYVLIAERLG